MDFIGGHQDYQEEQDRDGGRSDQDQTRDTDHVLSSTSQHHTHLRRWEDQLLQMLDLTF